MTNPCIFKSNLFTKLEINLVEFPLSMIQLIKTNVFHQDMDIQNNYIMFICISFKEKKVIWDPLLESGVAPESEHGGSTKLKYDKVSRWVFLLKIFLANFLLFFFCRGLGGTPSANQCSEFH